MKKLILTLFLSIALFSCENKPKEKPNASIEVINDIENLSDSIQVKHIKVGSENPNEKKKFHVSYPSTLYDFINKEEEEFAQRFFNDFKENSKKIKNGVIDYGQHFELEENCPQFMSFFIERYTSLGNNYDTRFFTHVYDLKNKKKIEFSNLFNSQQDFEAFAHLTATKAEKLIQQKINQMKNLSVEDKDLMWENTQEMIKKGTEANNTNFDAFTWDKMGKLTIYFDKYQIASGDFGEIKISFLPKEYKNLFNNNYQALFYLNSDATEEQIALEHEDDGEEKTEYTIDCGEEPCVALTFDDGPSIYTPKLLDILKENDAKATFFVLGKSAEVQKNTILRIHKEGHQIGNHSWDHKDLKHLSKSNVEHQIYDTNNVIEEITGEKPHLMRPPYGSMNSTVKEVADMPIILWNLDPMDWKNKDSKIVAERMSKANKNGIVLAHDIHKTTVDAIPSVIKALKEKGYHLVTIDELFAGQELKNGVKYSQRKNK